MTNVKEKKDFSKIEKITKNFILVSCVILGSIFLAACAYMLMLISDAQNETQAIDKNQTVQNMNLVSM